MYSLKPQDQGLITFSQQDYLPLMVESFLEKYSSRVFLDPTRSIMETCILPQADPIIVLPLISQSPCIAYNGISFPKLEKSWWIYSQMEISSSRSRKCCTLSRILSILEPFKWGHFNFAHRGLYYFALTQSQGERI